MTQNVYIASCFALRISPDSNRKNKDDANWEHAPVLLVVSSIEEAKERVKRLVLDSWPRSKGWSNHSAVLKPATNPLIANLQSGGFIEGDDNPLLVYLFKFEEFEGIDQDFTGTTM